MSSIVIEGLGMVYRTGFWGRKREALKGLDLTIEPNEIFGYVGPNGAGKTTTIKILVGLQRQTVGRASILGKDISDVEARRNIGYMPENPYFYEYLTTEESLHFYGKLCGMSREQRRKRVPEMIEYMNIPEIAKVRVGTFSKGMRQRIGLAQAIIHDPEVVILDEPLHGLDPVGRRQLREKIVSLKEQGKTVFFSSHILSDVEQICDRIGMLFNGELAAAGDIESLLESHVGSIEISVRNLPPQAVENVKQLAGTFTERESVYRCSVSDQEKGRKVLKLIEEAGGEVLSYVPQRVSLEDYFMARSEKGDRK
ncbi:MAG: ABC transporter ATP-binding protein [Planctomycetes bacterium]|nr:ABC transporter ATP-binding protein [Planctomycetota bacterium]